MSLVPLVETIVKGIVGEPEAVSVEERTEREGLVCVVNVAPSDVGKMIGKNGRVISAIRNVVSAAASKQRKRAYVKVNTLD